MSEPIIETQPPATDSAESKPWYETAGLAPELVSDCVKKYASLGDYVKGMNEAQELIGGKFPSDKTSQEFNDKFYRAAGRPDKPDDYEFTPPEGVGVEQAYLDEIKKTFHELGLTKKQFSGSMGKLAEILKRSNDAWGQQMAQAESAAKAALQAPDGWGDRYEHNREAAFKEMERLGVLEILTNSGAIHNAAVMQAFFRIADADREGQAKVGESGADKAERIRALKADPAYRNPADPRHAEVVRIANDLMDGR